MWKGATITGRLTGATSVVGATLGEGTFGRVSQAILADGRTVAVKLLKLERDDRKGEQLATLCRMGRTHPCFVGWPWDYGRTPNGYWYFFMDLAPATFWPMNDYLTGKQALSLRALLRACFHLADAMATLHLNGLAFQDVSSNQVLLTSRGDAAIVDCDAIDVEDAVSANGGTRGYLTVKRALGQEPASIMTDAFALGVLLFQLMTGGHPQSGMKESTLDFVDDGMRNAWYRDRPLFVFSKSDRSNWPDPTTIEGLMTERWLFLPTEVRDAFHQHFTEGPSDSSRCILETQWRELFGKLPDAVFACGACGSPALDDPATIAPACRNCDRLLDRPQRLEIRRASRHRSDAAYVVTIANDMRLYAHHVDGRRGFDFTVAGRLVRTAQHHGKFVGLQNLTSHVWRSTQRDGSWRRIAPQEVVPLTLGSTIHFPGGVAVLA